MATVKADITLKHRANTGAPVSELVLSAGAPITILSEWEGHYLTRDGEGRILNVPKDAIEP